jgi:four helix bundle protein
MHQRPYEKLIAWQEAHKLCLAIYALTRAFPSSEKFRLINQLCRSAYGVPMNIAEGNMRRSMNDKARFFEIAVGSIEELHYQCRLSRDLQYISALQFQELDQHINRTSFLITKLRTSIL